LFVGDAICSVSIIDVVEVEEGEMRLESVAKDFSPLWPVTVESLDQDTIIGANVSQFPHLTNQQQDKHSK
jgi:DNA damage-binding protein 1